MSTLKNSITIPKDVSTKNDLDYQFLKQAGINYIESMGGGLWTEYNESDPGITMLEMLSYTITDLGNRINLPIQDLLTSKTDTNISEQFYTASEILISKPVTSLDYRKIFIDMDEVRNCWIMPYQKTVYVNCKDSKLSYNPNAFSTVPPELRSEFNLKGLNTLLVDYNLDPDLNPTERAAEILLANEKIRTKYHKNRNLCEDLVDIREVGRQPISICAEIEVENTADEDEVHARVLFAIDQYFAPNVHFYSLKQMLDKGYRTDEVFDGPFLEHGFIDTGELRKAGLRTEVRLSDIMQLVSAVKGVKLIKDITIGDCDDDSKQHEWLICIESGKRPSLCSKSTFSYRKDVIPVAYNKTRVDEIYDALIAEEDAYNELAKLNRELQIPEGEYFETGFYTTMQNDFPDTYGIGQAGLAGSASVARKSQAKQLKAYLLFFDQVMASYFAHLEKVKDQLSVQNELKETYFTQAVKDIKGFSDLVENYPENDDAALSKHLMGFLDDTVERRNELLDHLLARFAERFSEYSFLMKELYGSVAPEMVLSAKEVFLKEYVELSSGRGTSFDYYEQLPADLWDTGNVTGAEKRIARLAGMKNYFRRNLSTNAVEIYEFNPSPGVTTYKWRIRNTVGAVILSSIREYTTIELAAEELYHAVMLIIETSPTEVEAAFDAGVEDDQIIGNLQVLESGGGNFYFQVIDPDLAESDPLWVVARQLIYHGTTAEFEAGMLETIDYMLNDFTEEGMFLVEHILLRPDVTVPQPPTPDPDPTFDAQFLPICADDCKSCCSADPYSFRVSVVLPGFTPRFANMDFRLYMEELIQEELPAHVLAKICWIGSRKGTVPDASNELLQFQTTFKNFLLAKTDLGQGQNGPVLNAFKDVLLNLNTIYPKGRLYDCDTEAAEGKIILGRTKLGTL